MSESKIFLSLPDSSEQYSYEKLLRDVVGMRSFVPFAYSENAYQQFLRIVAAIERDQSVALLPPGEDPQEAQDAFGDGLPSGASIGIFTSGTTGRPKLIWHSKPTLLRAIRISDRHSDDVWGFAFSPNSFAGVQVLLQAYKNQNPIIQLFGLPFPSICKALDDYNISHLSATPTFLKELASTSPVFERVRSITIGGEPVGLHVVENLKHSFPNAKIRNIYASTEVGSLLSSDGDLFRIPDSERSRIVVKNGELLVHKDLIADSLQPFCSEDGFYATRDFVQVVQESPLAIRIQARESDWINVGGVKVNPHFVEGIVASFHGIKECRVFGKANSVTGSIVCCEYVETRDGVKLSELRDFLRYQLSRMEVPRMFTKVEKIGRTTSGKIRR